MSNSKYEYVKDFESHNILLLGTYIVVRIDGKGFTKFCETHQLTKPNDIRLVRLMNSAAMAVCEVFTDIFLAYGQSDEYSFAFRKDSSIYQRREQKIISVVVSTFTSYFTFNWYKIMGVEMKFPATFDSRVVLYPDIKSLRDYFNWRQVDCHINNMYNTVFWLLIHKKGYSNDESHKKLKGTFSKDKHELLFEMGFNYNNAEEVFKKGNVIIRFNSDEYFDTKHNSKKKQNKEKNENKDPDDCNKVNKNTNANTNVNVNEVKVENQGKCELIENHLKIDNQDTCDKKNYIMSLFYDKNLDFHDSYYNKVLNSINEIDKVNVLNEKHVNDIHINLSIDSNCKNNINNNFEDTKNSGVNFKELNEIYKSKGLMLCNVDIIKDDKLWDLLLS